MNTQENRNVEDKLKMQGVSLIRYGEKRASAPGKNSAVSLPFALFPLQSFYT